MLTGHGKNHNELQKLKLWLRWQEKYDQRDTHAISLYDTEVLTVHELAETTKKKKAACTAPEIYSLDPGVGEAAVVAMRLHFPFAQRDMCGSRNAF